MGLSKISKMKRGERSERSFATSFCLKTLGAQKDGAIS